LRKQIAHFLKKWARHLNREFSIEEIKIKMVKDYIKSCSLSLAISKPEIKTTLRFHLTPTRMAQINCFYSLAIVKGRNEHG
jgi:alkyl hydroperoxide reductase subunit AhpC